MRREDFVFCIGFEGSTAIIDGKNMRRHRGSSTRQLAEAGMFKQAVSSAVYSGVSQELEEVLALYNKNTTAPMSSVEDLKRIFGVSVVPEGVKKITVV
jgi:hypothetical protein